MTSATAHTWRVTRSLGVCAVAVVVCALAIEAGQAPPAAAPTAPNAGAAAPAPLTDSLGRSTPRGTVRGFLDAARSGDNARAAQYLDPRRSDAAELAHKLFEHDIGREQQLAPIADRGQALDNLARRLPLRR